MAGPNLFERLSTLNNPWGRHPSFGTNLAATVGGNTRSLIEDVVRHIPENIAYEGVAMPKGDLEEIFHDRSNRMWYPVRPDAGNGDLPVVYYPEQPRLTNGGTPVYEEAQGPLPFHEALNVSPETLWRAIAENPEIARGHYNKVLEGARAEKDRAARNFDRVMQNPRVDPEDAEYELEDATEYLNDVKNAEKYMFPEGVELDPATYLGDEYAPWVRQRANKLVTGED